MKMSRAACLVLFLFAAFGFATAADAETLSWNAVTTYTDGTPIAPAAVTYQAYWTTSATLATGLTALGSSTTTTATTFTPTSAGMTRGSTVYFTVKATVGGVASANASPLQWTVPTLAPGAPANLRIQ